MSRLTFFVPGRPVPQGSKTAFVSKSTGRPIVVDKDVRLPRWRSTITAHAIDAQAEIMHTNPAFYTQFPLTSAVGIEVTFLLDRPKGHYSTGKNANRVKPGSPLAPAVMPDLDKLLRAVFDGLTDAQVWRDDAQVVWVKARKDYVRRESGQQEGVLITLGAMP